jgi:adenosine deaminase
VLEVARQTMAYGVVAWSIGGNEIGYPPEQFAEVFAAARASGLAVMAHAGEVAGAASVWGAVDALQVQRVGHGIHSIHDPQLLEHLRRRGVVLDVCPTSNLFTGAVASWEQHPIRRLYEHGVKLTINSDDPTFFGTTLVDEYRRIVQYHSFTADDLCNMVRTSVEATFLDTTARAHLRTRVESELARLREELGV